MWTSVQQVALLLAAQQPEAPAAQSCMEGNAFLMPMIMIGIFYFVWFLPARKERKVHQTMLESLKRGDEVITQSGLLGSISDMTDKIVTLEVAKNVKIRVLRSTVAKRLDEAKAEEKAEEKAAAAKETKASKS